MGAAVTHLHQLPGAAFGPFDPVVALTFDDGPGASTREIASALSDLQVTATFFVVGSLAAANPGQITELAGAGHTIGGHSWSHPRGEVMSDSGLLAETQRTAELLGDLTGRPASLVRPPYKKADAARFAAVLEPHGFTIVTWSVDPRDWATSDPSEISEAALRDLHPGAIVVLHDGGTRRDTTVEALPSLVEGIRSAGYRFVSL